MKLEHVGYNVAEPQKLMDWWCANLGFKQVHPAFIVDSTGQMSLEFYNNPAAPVPDWANMSPLAMHIALGRPSRGRRRHLARDRAQARLRHGDAPRPLRHGHPVRKARHPHPHMTGVHFLGIGGVGMAGVAFLLKARGRAVSGCDLYATPRTRWLEENGISVAIGHDAAHIDSSVGELVVTPAVPPDNPELAAARAAGITVRSRGEVLASLVNAADGIAVCGTHGKTTTATFTTRLLQNLGALPSWCIGGETGSVPVAGVGIDPIAETDPVTQTGTLKRGQTPLFWGQAPSWWRPMSQTAPSRSTVPARWSSTPSISTTLSISAQKKSILTVIGQLYGKRVTPSSYAQTTRRPLISFRGSVPKIAGTVPKNTGTVPVKKLSRSGFRQRRR